MSSSVVLCPFWSERRAHFGVKLVNGVPLCDNLVDGVPLCIKNGFFDDWDDEFEQALMVMSEAEARVKFSKPKVERCGHVVRSDVYLHFPKIGRGCFFVGDKCVYPDAYGFDACCVDCFRRLRK